MIQRNGLKALLLLVTALLLSACAATSITPAAPPQTILPSSEHLRQRLGALTQAYTATDDPLTVSYPEERLFAEGAVLPLPGGTTVLDPLALFLRSFPELRWQATVRARTEASADYDLALAQRRLQLLERYLHNRQVPTGTVAFQAAAEAGPPLELVLLTDLQAGGEVSSSTAK